MTISHSSELQRNSQPSALKEQMTCASVSWLRSLHTLRKSVVKNLKGDILLSGDKASTTSPRMLALLMLVLKNANTKAQAKLPLGGQLGRTFSIMVVDLCS